MFDLRQIRHTSLTEEYYKTNNKKAVSRKAGHTDEKDNKQIY